MMGLTVGCRRTVVGCAVLVMVGSQVAVAGQRDARADAPSGVSYLLRDYDKPPSGNNRNRYFGVDRTLGPVTVGWAGDPHVGSAPGAVRVSSKPASGTAGYGEELRGVALGHVRYFNPTELFPYQVNKHVDVERFQFAVRGLGDDSGVTAIRVRFTDGANHTATSQTVIGVDAAESAWKDASVGLDFADSSAWSTQSGFDPTELMTVAVIMQPADNDGPTAGFYLDDLAWVDDDGEPFDAAQASDAEIFERIARTNLQYFIDMYNPLDGLFYVSANSTRYAAGMSARGFSAFTLADEMGWMSHDQVRSWLLRGLTMLWEGQSPDDTVADSAWRNGYRGHYWGYLGPGGVRSGKPGLDTTSSGTLALALWHIGRHFADDAQISTLARRLYERIDWTYVLVPLDASDPHGRKGISRGWTPEPCPAGSTNIPTADGGCLNGPSWHGASEEGLIANLAALGSTTHPVPDDIAQMDYSYRSYNGYTLAPTTYTGSAEPYFFTHLWIDWRGRGFDTASAPRYRLDHYQNTLDAMRASMQMARDLAAASPGKYPAYELGGWGFGYAEAPGDRAGYSGCNGTVCSYGTLPLPEGRKVIADGTVQPWATAAAAMYLPQDSATALRAYFTHTRAWHEQMGMVQSFNLLPPTPTYVPGHPWYGSHTGGEYEALSLFGLAHALGDHVRQETTASVFATLAMARLFADPQPDPPEQAEYNDDDKAIDYLGTAWKHSTNRSGDYQKDVHNAFGKQSWTYTFWGDGVDAIMSRNTDQGRVSFSLDGLPATIVDTKATSRQTQQTVYTVRGLEHGVHTLSGTGLDTGVWMIVDAFKVHNPVPSNAP